MKHLFVISIILLSISKTSTAELPEREYWVAGGLGSAALYRVGSGFFSPYQKMNGFALNLGFYAGLEQQVFGLRIGNNVYPNGYPDVPKPSHPLSIQIVPTKRMDRIQDLGLLYGRRWSSDRYIATIIGGLGIAKSSRVLRYEYSQSQGYEPVVESLNSAALLFGADITIVRNFYSSPQIGIFVDVNRDRPYWCVYLGLAVGTFADRVGR